MSSTLQIVVIPVLIGLLFELLVVIPLRVPVDESPVFLLYQDWALGLVFLKIWTRLVSLLLPTPSLSLLILPSPPQPKVNEEKFGLTKCFSSLLWSGNVWSNCSVS